MTCAQNVGRGIVRYAHFTWEDMVSQHSLSNMMDFFDSVRMLRCQLYLQKLVCTPYSEVIVEPLSKNLQCAVGKRCMA